MPDEVVPYDSDEAASIKMVSGWVDRKGFLYGPHQHEEHLARWSGCTHVRCGVCGTLTPKHKPVCDPCDQRQADEKYASLPKTEWDGTTPIYSDAADRWFWNEDDLRDYCEDRGCFPNSLRLYLGRPVMAHPIEPSDIYCDDLPDDGEIPTAVEDAFEKLNAALAECQEPLSWEVTGQAVSVPTPPGAGEEG